PLETLPDLFGEYPPADRKKLSHEKLPAPTSALPRRLIVPLGRTVRVHDLEITPLRVSEQERYLSESKEGKPEQAVFPGPALALHLRLKNASREVYFHPTDPAFNRRYDPEEDGPPPYSYLRVGDDRYYGGPFDWPRKGARAYTPAQASDDRPLGPGEVRETVILSPPRTRFEDPAGRATSYTGGTMIWRVHLRTGLVSVGGRDYPVTSVIGVEFRNSDIREN
ncbi:MAG TPA: hypothetical protein VIL46_05410, partial [Gemmataceae bacterium]